MIYIIVAIVGVIVLPACAGASPEAEPPLVLAGVDTTLAYAIQKSDLIFQGTVLNIEPPAPTAPGQAMYLSIVIPVEVLKGRVGGKKLAVSITVRSVGTIHEAPPEINHKYIFFVQVRDKHFSALKLLPGDENSVINVRDGIQVGPATKPCQK